MAGLVHSAHPAPVPAKVTEADIEQIRSVTAAFRSLDHTHGGTAGREAVFAALRWSAQLLQADYPERLLTELFTAVAHLGGVAGFMAFDGYAHDDARRAFRFSLQCAEQAGNWQLRASTLADMARQAIRCGSPDDGLTFVETALVRADRLTATERAALNSIRAIALAKLHRTQEALSAVGAADEAFANAKPANDPPWMAYYNHAHHHGDTGRALYDLALGGRKTQAAQRFAYAVAHHGEAYVRSRALDQTRLASLLMATGDPRHAAVIGNQALDAAASLNSRRLADDLRELRRLAHRHGAIPAVSELSDRITDKLAAV